MGFTTFGLSDNVMKGIRAAGYTSPTPIQSLAIKPALEGQDIIGSAQTGTGKTAAFVLPMLHRLDLPRPATALPERIAKAGVSSRPVQHVRALVITPTRELAQQVHDAVVTYGKFLRFRPVSIYGGVSMEGQLKLLRRGADIVIATPGRLLDHVSRRTIDLSKVEILVLDEADRMLDMGFINDVRKIIGAVPKVRQTMLFSATISDEIQKLASTILTNPHKVEAGERRNPAETITQHFYSATPHTKMDLLLHAIESEKMGSILVFSRTKHGADKICRRLEREGVKAIAIHSNRTQSQRQRALDGFKKAHFRVLVATDIAARGIDVDGISHVINFDIPQYAEDYIHRIGRTGRAGAVGDAITFVTRDDNQHLKNIERFVGKRYPVKSYAGFTPPPPTESAATVSRPRMAPTHGAPRHQGPVHHSRHAVSTHKGGSSERPVSNAFPKKTDFKRNPRPGKKKAAFQFAKKKTSARKMEAFSSDRSGAGWSNY